MKGPTFQQLFEANLKRDPRWQAHQRNVRNLQNVAVRLGQEWNDVQPLKPVQDEWQRETSWIGWMFSPVTNILTYWGDCYKRGQQAAKNPRNSYMLFRIFRRGGRLF